MTTRMIHLIAQEIEYNFPNLKALYKRERERNYFPVNKIGKMRVVDPYSFKY